MALPTFQTATTQNYSGAGQDPLTFNRTFEADCTVAFVAVLTRTNSVNSNVVGVTINSVACTEINEQFETTNDDVRVTLFGLNAPDTGAQSVSVNTTGSIFFGTVHVITFKDTDPTTPWGTAVGAHAAASTTPAATCTLGANDLTLGVYGFTDATRTLTIGGSETSLANSSNTGTSTGGRLRTVTSTIGAIAGTISAATQWGCIACPVTGIAAAASASRRRSAAGWL